MSGGADWSEVRTWRRATRQRLLAARMAMPAARRRVLRDEIAELTGSHVRCLLGGRIGFYWPIQGEVDLRALVGGYIGRGSRAALPVVVARRQPLEFWAWWPRMPMRPGLWEIPEPELQRPVRPTVLLVPLLGFDEAGYRLGYGGGYYDRTLATMPCRPLLVGVGHELGRLPSIAPQPHDIPMDLIVTEAGIRHFAARTAPVPAAPHPARAAAVAARPPQPQATEGAAL